MEDERFAKESYINDLKDKVDAAENDPIRTDPEEVKKWKQELIAATEDAAYEELGQPEPTAA